MFRDGDTDFTIFYPVESMNQGIHRQVRQQLRERTGRVVCHQIVGTIQPDVMFGLFKFRPQAQQDIFNILFYFKSAAILVGLICRDLFKAVNEIGSSAQIR